MLLSSGVVWFSHMAFAEGKAAIKDATAAAAPSDDPVTLSLNSVVLFALSDNPDVRMALAREQQAEANTGKARAKYYPLIDTVLQESEQYNYPAPRDVSGGVTNTSRREDITLKQNLFDFGQTNATYRSQKQLQTSASLDTKANVENALNDTIQYYLQILQYQQTLKDTQAFVVRLQALVNTVSDMFEAGGTSKATLDYARSRLSSAKNEINNVRSSLNDSISNLEFLTDKLPDFTALPPDDLDPTRLDLPKYLRMAEENNTGVKLAESDIEAQRQKLLAAKDTQYPTFNFLMTGTESMNDGGEVGLLREGQAIVQMNYRVFDGYEQRNQIRLINGQIRETEINREKTIKQLRKQIQLAYNQIVSLRESKKQTLAETASSEALQALNRENFKLGSISIIELIEGEERLDAARARLHSLDTDLYKNTYRLLIASGLLEKDFFCETCQSSLHAADSLSPDDSGAITTR